MTKPFYIDATAERDSIVVWHRDIDGNVIEETKPIRDYSYCYVPANDGMTYPYKDLYGNMMKPLFFDSPWHLRSYAEDSPHAIETDVSPVARFMMDEYYNADIEWHYNLAFYDIEVDFDLAEGRGYPTPENPFGEINSIQIFDCKQQCYILFLPANKANLIHLEDEEYPIEIIPTADEKDMLRMFASYLEDVDYIGGWYTSGFDLPYIMERAIFLFGEKRAKTIFCRSGFPAKRREYIDDTGRECVEWTLIGIQHFDMLDLYKKFNPGEKPNFKLDTICELEGVGRKVSFTGDLGELYRRDPQRFYEYAIHDVRLLKDLDKKTDTMKLAITMARESCVHVKDVSSTVKPIEHAFMIYCKENGGIVLPNKKNNAKAKFPGAIVYDTLNGVHRWCTSIDLTALYPSVMIMLGLSTETLVMQIEDGYDGFVATVTESDEEVIVVVEATGEHVSVTGKELNSIIREEGFTISANGTIFDGSLGLLSAFVQSIFNKRVKQKQTAKEYYEKGDSFNGNRFNLFQKVTKIYANSLYGCIGNEHFRLFDLRMAKSITLTGQVVSKSQAFEANRIMKEYAAAV